MAIFNFGKYKGLDFEEVKLIDLAYIRWCEANVNGFDHGYMPIDADESDDDRDDLNNSNYGYDYGTESKYAGTHAHEEYDDFTIDNAFEGDPDLVWNVD